MYKRLIKKLKALRIYAVIRSAFSEEYIIRTLVLIITIPFYIWLFFFK